MRRYEITDPQWERIAHLLPGKVGHVGRSATDNRLFINRTGYPMDCPEWGTLAGLARTLRPVELGLSAFSALG